jgi:hypothetical protein
MKTGDTVKVRLRSFRTIRQYGSRAFSPITHICNAEFVAKQDSVGQPFIVKLSEEFNGLPVGHKIAVSEKDFNVTT